MRYLMIDKVTGWKEGEEIRGVKNVAMSEDFLEFHFQKNPIMPGVLLLEALAQLTGWLEAASSDFRNWFLVTKVNKCKFYGFAFPGDRVELEVRLMQARDSGNKVYAGSGTVAGKKKIIAEFEGETIPLEDIEDRGEQKKFFGLLTRE